MKPYLLISLLAGALSCAHAEPFQTESDNVPMTDLMVRLPDANLERDLDALAQSYLQRPAPAKPKTSKGPSQLDISEVVLSRDQWLAHVNQEVEAALSMGHAPRAELKLAQVLGEYSDAHAERLRLVALLEARGALSQAQAVLQEGIRVAPAHSEFRQAQARLLMMQGRHQAAWQVLDEATPLLAEHLDYYALKAEAARRSKQWQQAQRTYQQLLAHQSRGSWWLGLGLAQRALGEAYQEAFLKAQASAELGAASQRYIAQQLEQYETSQTH